jgi:hypothetical protein
MNGITAQYHVSPFKLEDISDIKIRLYTINTLEQELGMREVYYYHLDGAFQPKSLQAALEEDGVLYE